MLFQDKLKELRKKNDISQYDLANTLNISRSVIAKWEAGITFPSEESTRLLMDYFNVSRSGNEYLINANIIYNYKGYKLNIKPSIQKGAFFVVKEVVNNIEFRFVNENKQATSNPVYQWDYGQQLYIYGLNSTD